jgi:2-keto-4-pentenoate hydratase/2-oxohepta-3-ene-1,7-dioic acid hydratase in catechol pathway
VGQFHYGQLLVFAALMSLGLGVQAETTKYVRYELNGNSSYGVLAGEQVRRLNAAPYDGGKPTGETHALKDVRLLAPAEPSKVIAVGYNYLSHRGDRELPPHPPIFLKLPTTIIGPGDEIIFPEGATNVHYEGELVVVIGKTASRVTADNAADYIFGITAGNDVSARDWQADDLQWFRAKAADTFGPLGPVIVSGLNYRDLLVQTRLNGEVMQSQRTRDHIHDIHEIVAHISNTTTLYPGDLIFTGTPGSTSKMVPGDVVEIEVEGVGVLRNRIGTPPGGGASR